MEQWVQRYNGPGNSDDYGLSIALDNYGNIYVTGVSGGNGTATDYATIKYDSSGIQQWIQRYNGPANYHDAAYKIYVNGTGNVYITGYSYGIGTDVDYATIKYNSQGVQQWIQRYDGPANNTDGANSLTVDLEGNVYVTGRSAGISSSYDYATVKYNESGIQQWVQRYNGPGNNFDETYSIALDSFGNIYVTGYSSGSWYDYATIKYNPSGVQQWVQRYNGPGGQHDYAHGIAIDVLGNIYLTGLSYGVNSADDYATIKYNPAGVQQWVQRYNGPGNNLDWAFSIDLDISGNVYVTGMSTGNETGRDFCTVKYSNNGLQQWIARYNGTGNGEDLAWEIKLDKYGNIYVTGMSTGNGSNLDYLTIKYSQTIGIQPISTEIPNQFSLWQNYPNPFNPTTKIRFALPKSSFAKLVLYNILGKEISTLVSEQLNAGTYEAEWNATNYPSGMYFYKLITTEFTQSMKMILLK